MYISPSSVEGYNIYTLYTYTVYEKVFYRFLNDTFKNAHYTLLACVSSSLVQCLEIIHVFYSIFCYLYLGVLVLSWVLSSRE